MWLWTPNAFWALKLECSDFTDQMSAAAIKIQQ